VDHDDAETAGAAARAAGPAYVSQRYTWDNITDQLIATLVPD
jgi:hypothetical protein